MVNSGLQKNQLWVQRLCWNTLQGNLIFKISFGDLKFGEHPIPLHRRGGAFQQHPTQQGCHYHVKISAFQHHPTQQGCHYHLKISALTTLQFPPTTFFPFENSVIKGNI